MAEVDGFGAQLWYGSTSAAYTAATANWTQVSEVTDVTPPEEDVADIDTTHHGTSGKVKTYQAGLVEPGEVSVTFHYDKTVFGTLRGLRSTTQRYRILYSDGSGIGFEGYLKGISQEVDIEGLTVSKAKIKISGDQTAITAVS